MLFNRNRSHLAAMPRISKVTLPVASSCLAIFLSLAGCSGGVVPDEPAKMTPEREQKILEQVEQSSGGEQGEAPSRP
jgi:hypothetical protein